MDSTNISSNISLKNNIGIKFPIRAIALQEMLLIKLQNQVSLENMISGRPVRVFFEIDDSGSLSHAKDYFESRGYSLVFEKNNDEYFLSILTRKDFEALGLEKFNFDSFLNYKTDGSKTYLAGNKEILENELNRLCSKLAENDSSFTKDEELSIIDEFFN